METGGTSSVQSESVAPGITVVPHFESQSLEIGFGDVVRFRLGVLAVVQLVEMLVGGLNKLGQWKPVHRCCECGAPLEPDYSFEACVNCRCGWTEEVGDDSSGVDEMPEQVSG